MSCFGGNVRGNKFYEIWVGGGQSAHFADDIEAFESSISLNNSVTETSESG